MANEITDRTTWTLRKGNLTRTFTSSNTVTQTGNGLYHNTSSIGTTEESIGTFGDIATEGDVIIRNLDATNYVQVGFATGVYGMRLAAGRVAKFPAEPGLTLFLKANTAACLVEILVSEA